MKLTQHSVLSRLTSMPLHATALFAVAVGVLSPSALFAQDTTPPTLTSLSFAPATINVTSAPANVTVNFAATDNSSGVFYIEVGFVDPTGTVFQRGCASAGGVIPGCGLFTGGTSVTSSLTVSFPRFSTQGAWTVGYALLFDSAFNLTLLGPLGFAPLPSNPGALQVNSVVDTTAPLMTAFTLSAASIDTTGGPATLNMNFTLTDDISGAAQWQIAFTSPSGSSAQSATVSLTPATTVSGTASITFPQFSEAGIWTISSVTIADAVGNTTVLGTSDLTNHGFTTTLTVVSTSDVTPPTLNATTGFSFTPATVSIASSPGTVAVSFQATDPAPGPSGVNSFQALFTSPSGTTVLGATSHFAATASASGTAPFTIPLGSETGTWVVSSVTLTDAAGNVKTYATSDLIAAGFPTQLTVTTAVIDTPVIVPTVNPAPNGFGWNNTPITLTWSVTDSNTTIASTSGCGTVSVSVQTAGTTFTCSATNSTGGSSSASVVVKIDFTPPSVAPMVSPTPNGAGWNNTNVTLGWSEVDALSGVEADSLTGGGLPPGTGCITQTLTAETAGIAFTCMVTDQAGNSTSASYILKIDKTAPTLVFGLAAPAPNGAGWNNTNVSYSYTASDNLSGVFSALPASPVVIASEGTGLTTSVTVTDVAGNSAVFVTAPPVKIDKTPPVASGTIATPNPVQINTGTTITSTITDPVSGGVASGVASAQFNVDGGAFTSTGVTGTFGGATANISIVIAPYTATGIHTYCVQGIDAAGNVGNSDCVIVAVFDPNGGFVTGGGAINSPAGADAANPTATGTLSFGFNFKYLPNTNPPAPSGNLEVQFQTGNLTFNSTGFDSSDYLVITSGRGQVQGNGTLNGSINCKFQLDAWSGSFQPGNVDAFGLTIYNCASGPSTAYNIATQPTTRGSIKVHQ